MDKWKKMWYIYTMDYYSAIKKNEIMPLTVTWMDLKIIILSEVSQTEKDKNHMILLMWEIEKEKVIQMNLFTTQKQIHRLRELIYASCGEKWCGGRDWEFVIDIYTLLDLKKITNKIFKKPKVRIRVISSYHIVTYYAYILCLWGCRIV